MRFNVLVNASCGWVVSWNRLGHHLSDMTSPRRLRLPSQFMTNTKRQRLSDTIDILRAHDYFPSKIYRYQRANLRFFLAFGGKIPRNTHSNISAKSTTYYSHYVMDGLLVPAVQISGHTSPLLPSPWRRKYPILPVLRPTYQPTPDECSRVCKDGGSVLLYAVQTPEARETRPRG